MKIVINILLSLALFTTAMPDQRAIKNDSATAAMTVQEELVPEDKRSESFHIQEAEIKKEGKPKEDKGFVRENKDSAEKMSRDGREKQESGNLGEKELLKEEKEHEDTADMEAETLDRLVSRELVEQELDQNKAQKILKLQDNETLENISKTGYTTKISRAITCRHTSGDINGTIKCNAAPNPLNPTERQLKANVVLTGNLKEKEITKIVENYNAGGQNNIVTKKRLKVTVKDAPGIEPAYFASPYVCENDGYAGYAYFEFHYSYCPNIERFYKVQESHVWLGCTRGDGGIPEYHPKQLAHKFNVYKFVPHQYKVAYDANEGIGSISSQDAVYDTNLVLNDGAGFKRTGHMLRGWNTKKDGSGTSYDLGQVAKNMTARDGKTVTLYAQWTPNILNITYNGNKGIVTGVPVFDILTFLRNWKYGGKDQHPVNVSSFGLVREGYSIKRGAEWNTMPDGTGASFDQLKEYDMLSYAPGLADGNQAVILFAQWQPNIYTVTLDNQLTSPVSAGTETIYKKYETGIFLDPGCSQELTSEKPVALPQKPGYSFQGYYDSKNNGKQMIDSSGKLTEEGVGKRKKLGDEIWYAQYTYLVTCEDYADIPCDLEKSAGESREDPRVRITYNRSSGKVTIYTGQSECSITLTGMEAGTRIGSFQSSLSGNSASGDTRSAQQAELSMAVLDGTAYQLKVVRNGLPLCDRLVYYRDGRFRTLAKLGIQKAKEIKPGSSLAGNAWNTGKTEYVLYRYDACSSLKNIQAPGMVQRYFRYKDVNMAYSGNGATAGTNMLEYNVSLENFYQFRDNGFIKEKIETKYTKDKKKYKCKVKYSFQGWELSENILYAERKQEQMSKIYKTAENEKVISEQTAEDLSAYQITDPIKALPGWNSHIIGNNAGSTQGYGEGDFNAEGIHAAEYINFQAKWNAFPTITVNLGDKLEFFEGEEVTKEKMVGHLTAHDSEDNKDAVNDPDLNEKLRIVKVVYPQSKNQSQEAYEKIYKEDVPEDFLLDTYYLKLEKDETVNVLVTFAVTDSTGNTTEEEITVKVKYNNYPEICSEDVFYYRKEEANKGEITADALIARASAEDEEDGDITGKLELPDFDPQILKLQTESKAEFSITYQVTDAYRKTTDKTVKVIVWDDAAVISEMPKHYVRYISEKYLGTLEENSIWRQPENLTFLKRILKNSVPMETWVFTHKDVLEVQEWITKGGEGNWKIGQEANREFPVKFAHCRK